MTNDSNRIVSVIMPCYNDGAYIEEAISSVERQTYSDIELVIINDGSDDKKTLLILQNLRSRGITVIESNKKGPAAARNLGIKNANGKYILPLDSDDVIDSTYIEKAVEIIESDESIGGVYCLAEYIGKRKGVWTLPAFSLEEMLLDNVVFITTLFRKGDWEVAGGFDESLIYGMEDYDFWLSIMETGKTFYTIPEILFYYRIKRKSRTSMFQSDEEKIIMTYDKIYQNHKDFLLEHIDVYVMGLRKIIISLVNKNHKYGNIYRLYHAIVRIYSIVKRFLRKMCSVVHAIVKRFLFFIIEVFKTLYRIIMKIFRLPKRCFRFAKRVIRYVFKGIKRKTIKAKGK